MSGKMDAGKGRTGPGGVGINFARAEPPADLSTVINTLIDEAREEKEKNDPPRGKGPRLGPSQIGGDCLRKTAYDWKEKQQQFWSYKNDPENWTKINRFPGKILRKFELGFWAEDKMAEWLKMAGFDVSTHQPTGEDGKSWQYSFWVLKDPNTGVTRFGGFADGLIKKGPLASLTYPMGWENKVMNIKNWWDLKSKGVKKSHSHYNQQCQLYMAYSEKIFGQFITEFLFTALNVDTMEICAEVIKYDEKVAQAASDNAVKVILSGSPEEFPRVSDDPSRYPCGWCDHRVECHNLPPEPTDPEWIA